MDPRALGCLSAEPTGLPRPPPAQPPGPPGPHPHNPQVRRTPTTTTTRSAGPPPAEPPGLPGTHPHNHHVRPTPTRTTPRFARPPPARPPGLPRGSGGAGGPQELEQAVAVGRPADRHRPAHPGRELLVGDRDAVREHLLGRSQLPDRDRLDDVGAVAGEVAVDLGVVLAVVADQDPADVGELPRQPVQRRPLVLLAAAEPPRVGRAPVGQQQRAGRVAVPLEEPGQRRRGVPRPRGQVEDRRARPLGQQRRGRAEPCRARWAGACSCRTKVFQAAMSGRGSAVIITVSSMSLTRPNVTSAPTTCTLAADRLGALGAQRDVVPAGLRPGERTITST